MAKATVICKCKKCGKDFKVERVFGNRRLADEWEATAGERYDVCHDCYREQMNDEITDKAAMLVNQYNMPEIVGASEKQIKYANDLRAKYLLSNARSIDTMRDKLSKVDPEKLDEYLRKEKVTYEKFAEKMYAEYEIPEAYKLYTMTNASEIINLLK